jgi:hypothetical protein
MESRMNNPEGSIPDSMINWAKQMYVLIQKDETNSEILFLERKNFEYTILQ